MQNIPGDLPAIWRERAETLRTSGIEALFASGRPGITAEIVDRTQLLLGVRESFKNELRSMYEARSAIVHGGFGFPPLHFPFENPPGYERRRKRVLRAGDLAAAVLVASIQRLVERNSNRLTFEETLTMANEEFDQKRSEDVGYEFRLYEIASMDAWLAAELPDDVENPEDKPEV